MVFYDNNTFEFLYTVGLLNEPETKILERA